MDTNIDLAANARRARWFAPFRTIFGVDLRALAVLRIGVGLLLLVDLVQRTFDVTAFYSDEGTMPRALLIERGLVSPWGLSIHLMSGQAAIQLFLFALAAVFALALTLGFRTKVATVASWALLVSLQYRNPIILQGGDVLLRLLLFWGMFLPWAQRLSMDCARQAPRIINTPFLSTATAALLLQICFVYWFSARLKSDPSWTRDFTAVYDAFSLDHFATPLAKALLPNHRLLRALTAATYWIEAIGPIVALLGGLITWRLRTAAVFFFIAFHAGMAAGLELGLFPAICSVAWLVFLPAPFCSVCQRRLTALFHSIRWSVDRIIGAFPSKTFERRGLPQSSSVASHRAGWPVDGNPGESFGAGLNNSCVVSCAGGSVVGVGPVESGSRFSDLAPESETFIRSDRDALPGIDWERTSPDPRSSSAPAHSLSGEASIGPGETISAPMTLSIVPAPSTAVVVKRWTANALALFFLIYVLLWNLRTTDFVRFGRLIPPSIEPIGSLSGIAQIWDMFSPGPLKEGGWFIMPARLANGKSVDIFRGGARVTWEKPAVVSRMYPNDRWRKYMVLIATASNAPLRSALAEYLTKHWNSTHASQQRIVSLEIILMEQDTLPEKGYSAPRPIRLWTGKWNP